MAEQTNPTPTDPQTPEANTDTGPEGQPIQPQTKTFTQDELNRIAADARASARSKAIKDLLAEAGDFENTDDLIAIVKAAREREQADMSELDRYKKRVEQLESVEATYTETKETLEQYQALIQSRVDSMLEDLKVPEHIKKLLEPMSPAETLAYLDENRKALQPKTTAPNINANSAGGNNRQTLTELEKQQLATSLGVKPEYLEL